MNAHLMELKTFLMNFKYLDWFDVFLFGGWMVLGFFGGYVATIITGAFYQ